MKSVAVWQGIGKAHGHALCDILYKRLKNTLTYLLTYYFLWSGGARQIEIEV